MIHTIKFNRPVSWTDQTGVVFRKSGIGSEIFNDPDFDSPCGTAGAWSCTGSASISDGQATIVGSGDTNYIGAGGGGLAVGQIVRFEFDVAQNTSDGFVIWFGLNRHPDNITGTGIITVDVPVVDWGGDANVYLTPTSANTETLVLNRASMRALTDEEVQPTATISPPADLVTYDVPWSTDPGIGDVVEFELQAGHNYVDASTLEYRLNFAGDTYIDLPFRVNEGVAGRVELEFIPADVTPIQRILNSQSNGNMYIAIAGNGNIAGRIFLNVGTIDSGVLAVVGEQLNIAMSWSDTAGPDQTTLTVNGQSVQGELSTNFVGDWRVGANESLAEGTIGVIKNIKVYDAPVGGNLIAEWRINDNSNTIVDSVGGANGTLTLGSGSWEETGDLLAPQTLELINCANTTRDGLYRFGSIYSAVKDVGAAWAYEKQATSVNTLWVKDGTVDVNIGWGDTPEDAMVVRQTIAAGDSVLVPVTGSYIAWQAAADGTVHIEQSVAR